MRTVRCLKLVRAVRLSAESEERLDFHGTTEREEGDEEIKKGDVREYPCMSFPCEPVRVSTNMGRVQKHE